MKKPVLIYCLPGCDEPVVCGFTGLSDGVLRFGNVEIRPWPGCNIEETSTMAVCKDSTPHEVYCKNLDSLIADLGENGGKAVVARQICGTFNRFDAKAIAEEYFAAFPAMFRFFFYHESTGCWMGATPELLLEVKDAGHAVTRALAGTMSLSDNSCWDSKNLEEHRIVVDDMLRRIETVRGVAAEAGSSTDLVYGQIKHLCTPIELSYNGAGFFPADDIMAAVHPTAAVGGYPRELATDRIAAAETYPRHCYGGIIKVNAPTGIVSYVMLRCVHFNSSDWCIYSGSGITGASTPESEWVETEAKAGPLLNLLLKYGSRSAL